MTRKSLSIWDKKDIKRLANQDDLQDVEFLTIRKANDLNIDFSVFQSLKELWVNSKEPYQIPESFLELQELDKLILNENCILPKNIHLLKKLRELWLDGKGVLNPPYNIIKLPSIKELHILGDIELCSAPEWIFDMIQVEKIRFSVCRFTTISEKINQLKNLIDLDLSCSLSDLETFPDLSGLTSLKRLIVSGEAVQGQRLPSYSLFPKILESIKTLSNLEYLDLSDWRPKKKTEWLVTENKRNSIPDIFDRYPNLTELSLNGMKLDFLPSSIFRLEKLKKLSLNQNKLDSEEVKKVIQHLPSCIIESDVVYYKPKGK